MQALALPILFCWGQEHLPIQFGRLDVRQAVRLAARQQQQVSLDTDKAGG